LAIDQTPISLQQTLCTLQVSRKLQPVLEELASRRILEKTFQQRTDLTVEPQELEQAIDQFREQQGGDSAQFQEWLVDQAWDEAIFRAQVLFDLKLEKLKFKLAEPKLLEAFMEQKLMLDRLVLSRIVVNQRDLAEELLINLEEGATFEQLAREYSCSEDAVTNGMMGIVSRAEVQSSLWLDPYQAKPQEILGPIACDQQWWILRVEALLPATLDQSTEQYLRELIFAEWLTTQIRRLTIDLHLS
jgi:hypothetical protein